MSLSSENLKLIPFTTMIDPKDYWNLSVILLIIGFCSMSYFFINQITYKKDERSLSKEIVLGVFSSIFLSLGTLFLFLGLGLYF